MSSIIFVFSFSLLFFQQAIAASKVQVRTEEGQWVVEVISVASDGWPEITTRQFYPAPEQAKRQAEHLEGQLRGRGAQDFEIKPQLAEGVIWRTTGSWNQDWELRYAKWIENEVTTDFFEKHKIATDCADAAYALRWIFARIHGLPMASTLTSSRFLMTNETMRREWSSLPTASSWNQDRRFLAALNYLLNVTYTHTLWGDSFAVALNRDSFLSGTYHLSLGRDSGHTQIVQWLTSAEGLPFLVLSSTVPRAIRELTLGMPYAGVAVDGKDARAAYRRFRWAAKRGSTIQLVSAQSMPGYSLEQFQFKPEGDYNLALYKKLGFEGDLRTIIGLLYKDVLAQMLARKGVVEEGYQKCRTLDCSPGSRGWEDWGTPSRDLRLASRIQSLLYLEKQHGFVGNDQDEARPNWDQDIVTLEGVPWSVRSLVWNWSFGQYSVDPRDSIEMRWGGGRQSWFHAQVERIRQLLEDRARQLETGRERCRQLNCSFGTGNWSDFSSNNIDADIQVKMAYLLDGNRALPSVVLEDLEKNEPLELLKLRGHSITLGHVLRKFQNMSASPIESFEKQWGLSEANLLAVPASSEEPTLHFKSWLFDRTRKVLTHVDTGERFPQVGKVLAVFSKAPMVLVARGEQLALVHLETREWSELSPDLWASQFVELTGDRVLRVRRNQTVIYELAQGAPRLEMVYSYPEAVDLIPRQTSLYFPSFMLDAISLRLYPEVRPYSVYHATDEMILFRSSENRLSVLSRITGKISLLSSLDASQGLYISSIGDLIVQSIDENSSKVVVMNENFEVVREQTLPYFCWSLVGEALLCSDGKNGSLAFGVLDGNLHILAKGSELRWANQKFYARWVDGRTIYYDRATHSPVVASDSHAIPIFGSIVGISSGRGLLHFFDLETRRVLYTNVVPGYFTLDISKVMGGYAIAGQVDTRGVRRVFWRKP